MTPPVGARQPI